MKAPVMCSPRNNDGGFEGVGWDGVGRISSPDPRSRGTMPRSRTIKTKSDGVLPGRGRRRKRPLWCVQIVPSSRAMIRRRDLKGEKLDGRTSPSFPATRPFKFRCKLFYNDNKGF